MSTTTSAAMNSPTSTVAMIAVMASTSRPNSRRSSCRTMPTACHAAIASA
jgi:hypothetical protein